MCSLLLVATQTVSSRILDRRRCCTERGRPCVDLMVCHNAPQKRRSCSGVGICSEYQLLYCLQAYRRHRNRTKTGLSNTEAEKTRKEVYPRGFSLMLCCARGETDLKIFSKVPHLCKSASYVCKPRGSCG